MKKILVGLSGGVDSAVSAYLLKQAGYDVTAGFMINYLAPEGEYCPTKEDLEVAREVAKFLDIPFFTFDYRETYAEKVLKYMYEGYQKGITPNPDIMCNTEVKFKVFLDEALELGFDGVATGHYARIETLPLTPNPPIPNPFPPREKGDYDLSSFMEKTPNYIIQLSRKLRKEGTKTEEIMWSILRRKQLGYKFRRQHPFGRYIVDFYCDEAKLVIELDGKIHEKTREYDEIRNELISKYGVTIFRIKNEEVLNNLEGVVKMLLGFLNQNAKNFPLPLGEGLREGGKNQEQTVRLLKGIDPNKDQSYFLAGLNQFQLSKTLFPIGAMRKSEVRELAKKIGLPNANRKDSQGLCFVGKVDMMKFLEKKIKPVSGLVKDTSGKILGKHKGVFYYTIGQRKGLDIGGQKEPIFVVKKDIEKNEIIVGTSKDLALYDDKLFVKEWHFLANIPSFPLKAKAKIRYRQEEQDCTISEENGKYLVLFDKKQRAITSGQVCVVYLGDELVMSGVIE